MTRPMSARAPMPMPTVDADADAERLGVGCGRDERIEQLHLHAGAAVVDIAELVRGEIGKIDHPAVQERAAIVDPHHDAAAVLEVGDPGVARQRQRRMRSGHAVHVVALAGRRLLAMEFAAVPGGDALLHERRALRHRPVVVAQHAIGAVAPRYAAARPSAPDRAGPRARRFPARCARRGHRRDSSRRAGSRPAHGGRRDGAGGVATGGRRRRGRAGPDAASDRPQARRPPKRRAATAPSRRGPHSAAPRPHRSSSPDRAAALRRPVTGAAAVPERAAGRRLPASPGRAPCGARSRRRGRRASWAAASGAAPPIPSATGW